ncbi:MAG TPA: transcription-repair coupling factor [Bacilli bacterium]|nr:MAG: Transcription-repair-coupling factor [Tenericutes bacterium ADurb.BinA124]HNZ49885.1 transcription-repair coupling factor [Bacilli bacterium]HOH17695.1 transcription-repair coupling factor [Bacilli bacterium]HPX84243.1 transcription-repair coupling factor [Bacilli bacterium]HQC74126.1 transcription-repair coupling factor [Bacilli bacterium]
MNNVITLFSRNQRVKAVGEQLIHPHYRYLVNELSPHHGYLLTYFAFLQSSQFVIYVASNLFQANRAYEKFCTLAGMENVNLYLVDEIVSAELVAVSGDFKFERLSTIKSALDKQPKIIVTHTQAALRPLLEKSRLEKSVKTFRCGQEINLEKLAKELISLGYQKTPTTTAVGEFSVRGEVVDIFPPFYDSPVRIGLFDVEIEQIKTFDVESQRSIKTIDEVVIFPMQELIYDEKQKAAFFHHLHKDLSQISSWPRFLENDVMDLENYHNIDRLNKYIRYFTNSPLTILDYFDEKIVFYEEYSRLQDSYQQIVLDLETYLNHLEKPEPLDLFFFFDFYNLFHRAPRQIFLSEFKKSLNDVAIDCVFPLKGYSVIDYQNDLRNLVADVQANKSKTFVFACSQAERIGLLKEIFKEAEIKFTEPTSFLEIKPEQVHIMLIENALSFGFFEDHLEVLTEAEIFKTLKKSKARFRSMMQNTQVISSRDDLQSGDYVVHYDYGIGKYLGIKTIELKEIRNDYIALAFANMEIYIPVEKINLLEKYQGSEGTIPKLTNIGKGEWEKKKRKIQEKLETMAGDLISLQAEREQNPGFKYPPDSDLQSLFEEDFVYEETPDQLKAIAQVKADMEKGLVIDRLICGDVGYGKTEIAMRIAFKTVFSHKQVACLAPTTILTRQHFHSFKERFDKYGIRVELLNRLVSIDKQKQILADMKKGLVDIVIGTHRLLSEDIVFNDLGLLIIDEEQRFGVIHKEKIKQMKVNVNVLTLTATPIPRTLQMSIMGLRQLSLIETPPKDRYPVQTYVVEENEMIVKEAIYRELAREGQVFYLHNRVVDLDRLYRKLRRLVPEARIGVVHGQMSKMAMENAIQAFIDKEFNVLLCTTIIETGIDIPNTNTLIISRADYLGLAQMYQIRGRVGRTDRVAYAYLMYDEDKVLTADSTKRLSAIKEFTNLGSGYKIAVRDLAIRGAGDILGKEQSGFIDAVGFDMYMKMLNDAMNKVSGHEAPKEETPIPIAVSKHVDPAYVSDDDIKIYIHKEIAQVKTKTDKEQLISVLTDRFGRLNEEILTYIEERYLQTVLKALAINGVLETENTVVVAIPRRMSALVNAEVLFMRASALSRDIHFEYKNQQIIVKMNKKPQTKQWIFWLTALLEGEIWKKKAVEELSDS